MNSSGEMNDTLKGLLGDPEALGNMMNILKTAMNGNTNPEKQPGNSDSAETFTEMAEQSKKIRSFNAEHDDDNRSKLLCALKPYLSEGRREKIDYILNLMKMLHIASDMNLSQMLRGDN